MRFTGTILLNETSTIILNKINESSIGIGEKGKQHSDNPFLRTNRVSPWSTDEYRKEKLKLASSIMKWLINYNLCNI